MPGVAFCYTVIPDHARLAQGTDVLTGKPYPDCAESPSGRVLPISTGRPRVLYPSTQRLYLYALVLDDTLAVILDGNLALIRKH